MQVKVRNLIPGQILDLNIVNVVSQLLNSSFIINIDLL